MLLSKDEEHSLGINKFIKEHAEKQKEERKVKMKIEYEEINGLLYQKLALSPQKEIHLTRFGRKRLQYLKQYRPIIYT